MSDLFEEEEDAVVKVSEDFDLDTDLDIGAEVVETASRELDARRRLESMLDEKRLRDELDDFGDY